MPKLLRLQVAVEAETRKGLQVGMNEALAAVMNNNDNGHLVRDGRRVWYTVETVSEPAIPLSPPEPELAAAPEPLPSMVDLQGAIPTEIPPPPPVVLEREPVPDAAGPIYGYEPAAIPEVVGVPAEPDADDEADEEPF